MNPEENDVETPEAEILELKHPNPLHTITPLSKYLATALFVALPFLGGWVGYTYSPEKVVEVQRVVVQEIDVIDNKLTANDSQSFTENLQDKQTLVTYRHDDLGIEFDYPEIFQVNPVTGDYAGVLGLNFYYKDASGKEVDSIDGFSMQVFEASSFEDMVASRMSFYNSSKISTPDFAKFDEYDARIDSASKPPYPSFYTYEITSINGYPSLLHRRNSGDLIGSLYSVDIWIGTNQYVSISTEGDKDTLDLIYRSVRPIVE
jgi:hypothetical protein